MNVADFLRWALTKPAIIALVIVAALLGGIQGWRSTSSHYESSAAVLVIPPGAGSTVPYDNPFTRLDSGTAQVAFILTTAAQSDAGRAAVAKTGASPDVPLASVAGEGNVAQLSPQITFTVSGPTPEVSQAGAKALVAFFHERLYAMQKDAGVADGTYADLRVPVAPTPGVEVGGDAFRAAVGLAMGAALAALLLALTTTAALEAIRRRRAGAKAGAPAGETAAGTGSGTDPGATPAPATAGAATSSPPATPAAQAAREPGAAARRAMTRWRDRVEEVPEESEFPLPVMDDGEAGETGRSQSRSAR
ncbi:hypothetical protein [Tsukamurella sp. 1534]|uniref:hypothetical protein n=1 Tax=Tsukamurella sp. 1534 TaxID=1151061 RepID=UPI0002DAA097|nr:hypothetical protein [Tsukamurella sp. 1534]